MSEYLIDINATKAAERAGYSKNTVRQIGAENLSKPVIREAIQERIKAILKDKEELTLKVIKEYERLAFADISEFIEYDSNKNIKVKSSKKVDTRPISMVTESVNSKTGTKTFKFQMHDKKAALDSLGRYLQMFVDKSVIDLNVKELDEKKKAFERLL